MGSDRNQTESVMSKRDGKATEQDSKLDQQHIEEQSIEDLDASDDEAATVVGGVMMIDSTATTEFMG